MFSIFKIYIVILIFLPTILFAFEGKVFSVAGAQVTITGEGVAHLKAGQKFGVYNGSAKTGEIVVQQASHTQAKAKILSGTAAKDAAVREIVAAGSKPAQDSRYRDNGDGTVTVLKTRLVWQKCSVGQDRYENCYGEPDKMQWQEAVEVCKDLQLADKLWRLPTIEELKSLIYCSDGTLAEDLKETDSNKHPKYCGYSGGDKYNKNYDAPVINQVLFPQTNSNNYWTIINYDGDESAAWSIYFGDGEINHYYKINKFPVRCVSHLQ